MDPSLSVGVVGTGNMGSALVKGWLRAADRRRVRLVVWDKVESAAERLVDGGSIELAASLEDLAARSDIVLVVVKPKDAHEVLGSLAGLLRTGQVVVSSMAGITLEWMRDVIGPAPSLFRIMPNLGVGLGVGAVALAHEPACPLSEVQAVVELLAPLGLVEVLPEDSFDAVTGVSGSGPAFLALTIEGLEDGAVAAGLSRALSRRLVRQTAVTTTQILSSGSDSPAELKEHLATSGRLHIESMELLEQREVRSAFEQAVRAAVARSRELR